jgi:hypothetical protein
MWWWWNQTNWTAENVAWCASVALVVLIIYYLFMGSTVLAMLRRNVNPVLLTFAMIALLPLPPTVIMGIVLMIIWIQYRRSL